MEKQYIIGIDPGQNGGICAMYNGKIVDIRKLQSDPQELFEHLMFLGLPTNYRGELSLVIENVHSMPRDGHKGAFTFGKGLGRIEGVFGSMGLLGSLKRISPAVWMKYFGIVKEKKETKTSFKNRLKQKAIELGKQNFTLATCDAYLIARYQNEIT